MTAKRESNLSVTCMITDRIGRQEVLFPINHSHYNFQRQQIHFGQISLVETMSKVKILRAFLDISRFGATGPPIVDKFLMLEIDCGFIVSNQKVLDSYF